MKTRDQLNSIIAQVACETADECIKYLKEEYGIHPDARLHGRLTDFLESELRVQ